MHAAHFHLSWSDAQEQPPRSRVVAIELIEHRRFRIERYVTTDSQRDLVCVPKVPRSAKGIGADAEARMLLRDPQTSTFGWA